MVEVSYESVLGLSSRQMLTELATFHVADPSASSLDEVFFATQDQMLTFVSRGAQLLDDLRLTIEIIYDIKEILTEFEENDDDKSSNESQAHDSVKDALRIRTTSQATSGSSRKVW